jgi:hypothetical protein
VVGAGGSFCEIQALNFEDVVVEMGHDGPAHLAVSSLDPLLRGLGVYHGKRGWGVSVEFDVRPGPVTLLGLGLGLGQDRDGSPAFIAPEGTVVPGPLLKIGNTTSRVDFGRDPGSGPTSGAPAASAITGRCRWTIAPPTTGPPRACWASTPPGLNRRTGDTVPPGAGPRVSPSGGPAAGVPRGPAPAPAPADPRR